MQLPMAIHLRPAPSSVRYVLARLPVGVAFLVVGCGQTVDPVDASLITDAASERLDAVIETSQDVQVDRRTPCGDAPEFGLFACCDSGACRGGCYADDAHAEDCNCAQIWGGCKAPYVCCAGYGCKTEDECRASGGP